MIWLTYLRSGRQTPINVVFNNIRTKEEFAGKIASSARIRFFSKF